MPDQASHPRRVDPQETFPFAWASGLIENQSSFGQTVAENTASDGRQRE
jgi:hypothetical protein